VSDVFVTFNILVKFMFIIDGITSEIVLA